MDADGNWRMLTREEEASAFNRVLCSLQLVDRAGAVTRESLNRFQQAIANMAQSSGATLAWLGDSDKIGCSSFMVSVFLYVYISLFAFFFNIKIYFFHFFF